MKPFPHRSLTPFALALLSIGVLIGVWLLPAPDRAKQVEKPSGATMAPVTSGLSQPSEDEYRARIHALFAEVRRQTRVARKMPDVAALLAIADSIDPTAIPGLPPDLPTSSDDDKNRLEALANEVKAMSPNQRLRAFQQLLVIQPTSAGRSFALAALSQSLTSPESKGQPEAIARWLLQPANRFPDSKEVEEYASGAIVAWGHTNARAAADFAAELTLGTDGSSSLPKVLVEVCENWGKDDPAGALAWAKTLPDADVRKIYALEGVFSYFNHFDADEAKACVERMVGVDKESSELTSQVANELAGRQLQEPNGPRATAQWALSLPGVPERREALKGVIAAWVPCSAEHLSQAVQWATTLPPDETRGATWGALAISWEGFDAERGDARGSPAFFERLKINGNAADEWLHSLPAGPDREKAIAIREQADKAVMSPTMIWR